MGDEYGSSSESEAEETVTAPTKNDAVEKGLRREDHHPQSSTSAASKEIVHLTSLDNSLPPELARELARARKRGEPIVTPTLQAVDATQLCHKSTTSTQQGRGAAKLISAGSMRRSGVTKAARRNHHISELVAKVRAERTAMDTLNSLGHTRGTGRGDPG